MCNIIIIYHCSLLQLPLPALPMDTHSYIYLTFLSRLLSFLFYICLYMQTFLTTSQLSSLFFKGTDRAIHTWFGLSTNQCRDNHRLLPNFEEGNFMDHSWSTWWRVKIEYAYIDEEVPFAHLTACGPILLCIFCFSQKECLLFLSNLPWISLTPLCQCVITITTLQEQQSISRASSNAVG